MATILTTDTLVTQINRPKLTVCRRSNNITFQKEYDWPLRDRLRFDGIRECMKSDLLEFMFIMENSTEKAKSSEFSYNMVTNWYSSLFYVDHSDLDIRLNEIMKSFNQKPDPKDRSGAVVDYVHDVVTYI